MEGIALTKTIPLANGTADTGSCRYWVLPTFLVSSPSSSPASLWLINLHSHTGQVHSCIQFLALVFLPFETFTAMLYSWVCTWPCPSRGFSHNSNVTVSESIYVPGYLFFLSWYFSVPEIIVCPLAVWMINIIVSSYQFLIMYAYIALGGPLNWTLEVELGFQSLWIQLT